jgi:hypothetical protein
MADTAVTAPTNTSDDSSDILRIRSEDELRQMAEAQVNTSIQGQITPLQSDLARTQEREGRALTEIGNMFGQLLPFVADSAQRVSDTYASGQQVQGQIFRAAADQLNDLKQQRAQRAQQLAQETGGPVAIDDFVSPLDGLSQVLPAEAAASQLYALGQAQAGTQYSEAFAGKVFPALRSETELRTRSGYEDRINTLQDQINSIQSQKQTMVDARFGDLLSAERETALNEQTLQLQALQADRDYEMALKNLDLDVEKFQASEVQWRTELEAQQEMNAAQLAMSAAGQAAASSQAQAELEMRAQEAAISHQEFEEELSLRASQQQHDWDLQAGSMELDQLKADRDWKIAQSQLHNDALRINLAKKQFALDTAGVTGKYKGKPTLAAKDLSQKYSLANKQLKQAGLQIKQRANESDRDYKLRVIQNAQNYQLSKQKLALDTKTANARIKAQTKSNQIAQMNVARGLVSDLFGGTSSGPKTIQVLQKVPKPTALERATGAASGIYRGPGGAYYKQVKKTVNVPGTGTSVHNPNSIYKTLVGAGIPKSVAKSVTKARVPSWKGPGKTSKKGKKK